MVHIEWDIFSGPQLFLGNQDSLQPPCPYHVIVLSLGYQTCVFLSTRRPHSSRTSSHFQPAHPSVYAHLLVPTEKGHRGQLSLSTTPPCPELPPTLPPTLLFHLSPPLQFFVFLHPLLCAVLSSPLHSRCLLGLYQPLPGNNPDQFHPVPNASSQC